jgi:hypothetical protein
MRNILRLAAAAVAAVVMLSASAGANSTFAVPYANETVEMAQVSTPPAVTTVKPPIAGTGTTVQTTGDVQSTTKISVGTLAGELLQSVLAIFAVPVGGFLSMILFRAVKAAGVNLSTMNEAKLQESINRAVVMFGNYAPKVLDGKMTVDVKNQVVANAVRYVQEHRADTLKALGVAPSDPKTAEALKARAEMAIADPAVPTPEVVPPPPAPHALSDDDLEAAVVRVLQGIRDKGSPAAKTAGA